MDVKSLAVFPASDFLAVFSCFFVVFCCLLLYSLLLYFLNIFRSSLFPSPHSIEVHLRVLFSMAILLC